MSQVEKLDGMCKDVSWGLEMDTRVSEGLKWQEDSRQVADLLREEGWWRLKWVLGSEQEANGVWKTSKSELDCKEKHDGLCWQIRCRREERELDKYIEPLPWARHCCSKSIKPGTGRFRPQTQVFWRLGSHWSQSHKRQCHRSAETLGRNVA